MSSLGLGNILQRGLHPGLWGPWALAVATACGSSESTSETARPRPVRFAEARAYAGEQASLFPGRVRSEHQPAVSFRVSGRVAQVRADVGDTVRAGQLLASLDATDYRTRVAEAEAAVAQAKAEAHRTARTAERNARLYQGNAVSEAEFDQSKDLAESAAARLEAAQEQLTLAQQELSYTRLQAPESGTVVARRVDPGTNVRAGDPVVQLSGDRIEIRVDLPETVLDQVQVGDPAEVRIAALGSGWRTAKTLRVSSGTADGQLLYPVFVAFDDDGPLPAPGMSAEVRLATAAPEGGPLVAVPPTAVVADPEGTFVWLMEEGPSRDGEEGEPLYAVQRRSVGLTKLTGRSAVIHEGLKEGERVVTAGVHYLSEGQVVRAARLPPMEPDDVFVEEPRTPVGISMDRGAP